MTQEADDSSADDFADDSGEIPTPGDWADLARRVLDATVYQMIDPANQLVKIGRFDAIAMIGEGGFGTVFKARDPELGRLVALKLCRTRSQRVIQAITAEAKALAQLDHPNIVRVYEPGRHDGGVFFAMQYIPGEDAARFGDPDQDPRPSWEQVVDVYRGAGRGLAAAHDAGIVHGDIKPSNILLDRDNFPRLADFGLAQIVIRDAPESTRDGLRHRSGTLEYMAPEVLRGHPSDALADQWSFCVSLLQTLDGWPPFYGETSKELLEDIELRRVEVIERTAHAELREVLRVGLSIDPRERFPDMKALVAALDRLREPMPESAPEPEPESPPDEPEPGSPPDAPELTPLGGGPAPSNVKRGALSASLVLVGTVGLTIGWLGRGRVEGSRPSDLVPLPSSPCALGGDAEGSSVDIDPRVVSACMYIRQGNLRDASDYWDLVYGSRRDAIKNPSPNLEDSLDKLAADTVIVVQTYRDQAERFARQPGKQKEAMEAIRYANEWTRQVAYARVHGSANDSTDDSSDPSVETTN